MGRHACYAEVRFGTADQRLMGVVTRMNSSGLTMVPESGAPFAEPDLTADIVVIGTTGTFTAPGRITERSAAGLAFAFTAKLRKVNRRQATRVACALPVSYRSDRGNLSGPWQLARTINLSTSGMCMETTGVADIATRLHLSFYLPAQDTHGGGHRDAACRARTGSVPPPQPIRVHARTVHVGRMPDGSLRAGLAFTSLSPRDQMRLYSFIGA